MLGIFLLDKNTSTKVTLFCKLSKFYLVFTHYLISFLLKLLISKYFFVTLQPNK